MGRSPEGSEHRATRGPGCPRGKHSEPPGRSPEGSEHRATRGPGCPRGKHSEPPGRSPEGSEHRATPGGYGGKPPGVAFIGAPTGARNAGNWYSSGGPEHRYACYTEPPPCASRPD